MWISAPNFFMLFTFLIYSVDFMFCNIGLLVFVACKICQTKIDTHTRNTWWPINL